MQTIWRFLLIIFLLDCSAADLNAQETPLSGGDVASGCANYPEAPKKNLCEFWVSEVVEMVKSDDKLLNPLGRLCPPDGVPLADQIAAVNKWLAAHPELHKERAYKAIYGAFRQEYRCR